MKCNVCKNDSILLFEEVILNKYKIKYYQCSKCSFIQTETPYWLNEVYSSAIASLDIGLLNRNLFLSDIISNIISNYKPKGKYLDYAGGYGLFVRLMRDKGFDFYWIDKYCENLFAKGFESSNKYYDLVTALEVFEHFADPVEEINEIFKYSNTIIFSTELSPKNNEEIKNWRYISKESGQHISFYSYESLKFIANYFNLYLYSNKKDLHVFSKDQFKSNPFSFNFKEKLIKLNFYLKNRKSLINSDVEFIREKIKNLK
ncbi:MAG: class I SAM-dependent methyltransferase [Syntrophothermus sp.]